MDLTCLDLACNICMCYLYWLFPILAKLLITFDHDLELIVACLYNLCLILIEYWEQYAQLHWSCCLLDPLVPEWNVQYAEYRSLHAWIWPETEGHAHLDWHCLCSDSNMIPPDTTLILHLTMHDPPDLCLHVIYWHWDIMTVWLTLVLDVLPCAYMTWQHNIPKMWFISQTYYYVYHVHASWRTVWSCGCTSYSFTACTQPQFYWLSGLTLS